MPTADQLAHLDPVDGDDSSSEQNEDGSTTISWPDGTARVNYPDGTAMITYSDDAVMNIDADGTKHLNDSSGAQLDPSTGQPLGGGEGPLPTPPDQGPDKLLKLMNGEDEVADVKEAVGLVEAFKDALEGELDPAEWVEKWFEMLLVVIKAIETEERGCYMRGWCYAVLYSALDMGTPPEPTFANSLQGADQDTLDRQNWDEGVSSAQKQLADGANGISMRNRVLLRVARDGSRPNVTLDALWQAACEHTDDTQLARAYEHLGWPAPTGA